MILFQDLAEKIAESILGHFLSDVFAWIQFLPDIFNMEVCFVCLFVFAMIKKKICGCL